MNFALHCGSFEAERYWRDSRLASIPAIQNIQTKKITDSMDELLFVFCKNGDLLLTRHVMDSAQYEYIRSIGYDIHMNRNAWFTAERENEMDHLNVFEIMNLSNVTDQLLSFFPLEKATLEAFAVIPGTLDFAQKYHLASHYPEQNIVQRINAKSYSLEMRDRLNLPNVGRVVEGREQLLLIANEILCDGAVMLKDEFGVSGKGNLLIHSEKALLRLIKHMDKQAAQGKLIRFVVEPLLDRKFDFSCQLYIHESGDVQLVSFQQLDNHGYAFGASHTMSESFKAHLYNSGYTDQMLKIGSLLYQDGYFGDVCIDSMILQDGSMEPLVEINARKSMSLIKHGVDSLINNPQLHSSLVQFNLAVPARFQYEHLLQILNHQQILYTLERGMGILPLSSGTLISPLTNRDLKKRSMGRLYFAVIYESQQHMQNLVAGVNQSLLDSGLNMIT
ncbi:hypothetical protein NKT34_10235 [Paenibacillus polysaccharolyticus]|uniref:hypothetical protein n=1 Tax=Paenibacillus polysaccharolyticus TaxID=582692 RepID=UPI0020A09E79|nr:hypothetical protein [Paenibacillus polysaccharolyticus]MCP1133669.1 hypothetical protein [Paenibacillus polysaccharolyticus]